jgi:cathepsin L
MQLIVRAFNFLKSDHLRKMILLLLCSATCALYVSMNEEKSFVAWMRETKQIYSGEDYHMRLGIWLANSRIVREHRGNFEIGLNRLAALTPAEYKMLCGARFEIGDEDRAPDIEVQYDENWDWRARGVVNPIKDQGQCGSCWAFSAIGCAESVDAINSSKLLSFSESNVIDCVQTCWACNGGIVKRVWDWFMVHQGGKFSLEKDYPYKPQKRTCNWDPSKGVGSVHGYIYLNRDEEQLCTRCQQGGPVSVGIDASLVSFQLYTGGIYDDPKCSASNLDHAVILVGWGVEGEKKFWIIRNSWGLTWGERGYIRIIRKNNECGVASQGRLMFA